MNPLNLIAALNLLLNTIMTLLPMGEAEIEQVKGLKSTLQGYSDRFTSTGQDMSDDELQVFRDFDTAAANRLANAVPGVATPPANLGG